MARVVPEPFRIKMVEPIRLNTREDRLRLIEEAGNNPFLLRAEDIYIDLLTDSGVGAMSDNQWAGLMLGDESYAGCRNFYHLRDAVRDIMGFPYVLPVHQGRAAENVLHTVLVKPGDVVPGNTHFDTTKAHIEHKGGSALDCTVDESLDTQLDHPFKGNVDLKKLEKALSENAGKVPFVVVTATCNSGGGQPVSLANIREAARITHEHGVLFFIDAARYAENAYFIKTREPGCANMSVKQIAYEMFKVADGATMSSKKDAIVNIGGFIALRDADLYQKCATLGILFEGFPTYGGLAGRDLEAISRGLYEGLDEAYLAYRIGHVRYLAERLREAGVPVLWPPGGHAVYLDMKRFLPHVPQDRFPGHAFCVRLYVDYGIRAVEIGTLLNGRDPKTGANRPADLELVRFTIPRRVYTYAHLDYVAEAVIDLWAKRDEIKGVEFTYEPPILRHFLARFKVIQ